MTNVRGTGTTLSRGRDYWWWRVLRHRVGKCVCDNCWLWRDE